MSTHVSHRETTRFLALTLFTATFLLPAKPAHAETCPGDRDCDGVIDVYDFCPDNPDIGRGVLLCGCVTPTDVDHDGVVSCLPFTGASKSDNCPETYNPGQEDADADKTGDVCDGCPTDPLKTSPGACGCGVEETEPCTATRVCLHDQDCDGTIDAWDGCPATPTMTQPGECGCVEATDEDLDGVADCHDNCPGGINPEQQDADDDGVGDLCDACPDDPAKTLPLSCGCNVLESDGCLSASKEPPDQLAQAFANRLASLCGTGIGLAAGTSGMAWVLLLVRTRGRARP